LRACNLPAEYYWKGRKVVRKNYLNEELLSNIKEVLV
jgi:hypothetical protein